MSERDNVQAALDAGEKLGTLKALGDVKLLEGWPFMLVPTGYELKPLEAMLAQPRAKRATVALKDAASFIAYVNRFKEPGAVIFADLDGRAFSAVLDYHEGSDGAAHWGKHRVSFTCKTTTSWDSWDANDEESKNQLEFARLIEDGIPDIAAPAGADLLEMVLTLEAKKDVQFRSSARLSNGQHQLRYEETINGTAGVTGQVDIPQGFTLAVEPFRGVGRKQLEARFRYRMERGVLSLWYELVRPEDVLQAAFDEVVAGIKAGVGEVPVLAGAAPTIA